MTLIWEYLPLIALILAYVPYSPLYVYFSIETSVQNIRAIGPLFMEILHFKELGDTSVVMNAVWGVNLVIDNLKAIGPLLMEILHFEDLGDTKVLSTNAVWVLT